MASIQCQRPVDRTKNITQQNHVPVNTCGYQKPADHTKYNHQQHAPTNAQNKCNNTCTCCRRKENEHSYINKVKDMANSAYKKVADQIHHHDQHNNGHRPNTGPKPVSPKQKEGSMTNCIPRIGDHKKRDKTSRKKKGNDCKRKDGSSSSDSESDNEAHVKRT